LIATFKIFAAKTIVLIALREPNGKVMMNSHSSLNLPATHTMLIVRTMEIGRTVSR
jgi:hypothetical protein